MNMIWTKEPEEVKPTFGTKEVVMHQSPGFSLHLLRKWVRAWNLQGTRRSTKNLNDRADGNTIFLWYHKGSSEYDVPILALHITSQADDEAEMFGLNWERLSCNLNRRAGGTSVHLWVRRKPAAYICDITATADFNGDEDLLKQGYVRVEGNTNKDAGGSYVFIWYRQTADSQKAISKMEVSTNDEEYKKYESEGFTPVNQDLNQGTRGSPVYLWYKKENVWIRSIRTMSVIDNLDVAKSYEREEVRVIAKNLNAGNDDSTTMYLYYY